MSYFSPSPEVIYYFWATLLILACVGCWVMTLFTLPGNWVMVGLVALFAWFYGPEAERGVSWIAVGAVVAVATLGEIIEFLAGAAGAAKQGGSRRGIVLSMLGAIAGSLLGAIIGVPIPFVGPIIAAVGGGAAGAFAGAYVGEAWKGRTHGESLSVSNAALVGRVLGTVGKLAMGAIMVVVIGIAALF